MFHISAEIRAKLISPSLSLGCRLKTKEYRLLPTLLEPSLIHHHKPCFGTFFVATERNCQNAAHHFFGRLHKCMATIAAADPNTSRRQFRLFPPYNCEKVPYSQRGGYIAHTRRVTANLAVRHRPVAVNTATKFAIWRRFSCLPPATSATKLSSAQKIAFIFWLKAND